MNRGKSNGSSNHLVDDDPSGKSKADSTKTHPTVYIVFFSLLLDLLAFTMILPLLPSLLEHYRVNDQLGIYTSLSNSVQYFREVVGAPERYTSVLFGGFLGSMFSFLQFVVSPIAGGLSDYYGRKPILLLSLFGIMSSYGVWAISKNFGLFVLARFIGGLSKGNISLSMAIITDVSNKNNRGKGMALVGIAFSLGFIIGVSRMFGYIFMRFDLVFTLSPADDRSRVLEILGQIERPMVHLSGSVCDVPGRSGRSILPIVPKGDTAN